MKITLNGEAHEVADKLCLNQLLESSGYREKRVAVEINRQIIPHSRYASASNPIDGTIG